MIWTLWTAAFAQGLETTSTTTPISPVVPSEADIATAKDLFRQGAVAYEEGRYEDAVTAFRRAYDLTHNPKLLFNIANALERKGDLSGSYKALDQYLAFTSDDERMVIERRMAALEQRITAARAEAALPQPAAIGGTVPVAPGFAVVPVDALRAPTPTTRPNTAKWVLFGVGAGVASASGVAASVTYNLGQTYRGDVDQERYENVRLWNNIALGVTGVAAAGAVVGLSLPSRRPVDVSLFIDGDGLTVAGRF